MRYKARYKRYKKKLCILSLLLIFSLLFPLTSFAEEKWLGTDDLVDSQMEELGLSAKEPLIDISQGNLGLFLFALGGFAAGVFFGYYWRKVFAEKVGK